MIPGVIQWVGGVLNPKPPQTRKVPPPIPKLKSFNFEVLTVDSQGKITKSSPGQAESFKEDLGNDVTLEMVEIPGGYFLMGTEDKEIERLAKKFPNNKFDRERRQHPERVKSFYIGKFEVTQEQYKQVMGKIPPKLENPSNLKFKGDKHPIVFVSWNDAMEFCKKLSEQTGRTYRLPTEAEWEYAARAHTITPFHFGETITGGLANYRATETFADEPKGKFQDKTTPVGQFYPNAFGLYDMHGNVWEWIDNNNYSQVLRGCSWGSEPLYCRSAHRNTGPERRFYNGYGFRVVHDFLAKTAQ
ncbi:MAG: formylglycine-generating enzyme family protein [Nostocaceae cyanobacterium]|nr:formylglycine-generating enzyme family protein [Nostocaceae cyanobacterium]